MWRLDSFKTSVSLFTLVLVALVTWLFFSIPFCPGCGATLFQNLSLSKHSWILHLLGWTHKDIVLVLYGFVVSCTCEQNQNQLSGNQRIFHCKMLPHLCHIYSHGHNEQTWLKLIWYCYDIPSFYVEFVPHAVPCIESSSSTTISSVECISDCPSGTTSSCTSDNIALITIPSQLAVDCNFVHFCLQSSHSDTSIAFVPFIFSNNCTGVDITFAAHVDYFPIAELCNWRLSCIMTLLQN